MNPGSPYQSLPQLLDAMKAKPGQVTVATAGNSSSGHFAIEAIAKAAGIKYRHVTYDGGNPAVVATVAGETEVTTQLAVEQIEMIKGKRLRPLAVVAEQPVAIDGFGNVPPITQWLKPFPQVTTAFGIFIPKGVPAEVVATMDKLWMERIGGSEKIREVRPEPRGALYARERQARPRHRLADGGRGRMPPAGDRDGEGLARVARDQAALAADPTGLRLSLDAAPDEQPSARADAISGAVWLAIGAAILAGSWNMDRLEKQGVQWFAAPGLVPGILGLFILGAALIIVARSVSRRARGEASAACRRDR